MYSVKTPNLLSVMFITLFWQTNFSHLPCLYLSLVIKMLIRIHTISLGNLHIVQLPQNMQHCYSSLFSYNSFFPNIYCSPWSWHSSSHGSWVVHSSFIYWRKWFKSSILKAHWIISPPKKNFVHSWRDVPVTCYSATPSQWETLLSPWLSAIFFHDERFPSASPWPIFSCQCPFHPNPTG